MKPKIIVTGLPRSGTSMMMKLLEKGGLKAIKDERKPPTNSNPNGFYEYWGMENFPEWFLKEKGDCIKILVPQISRIKDEKHTYIFMIRDLEETANSFNKMHRADIWAMSHLRNRAIGELEKRKIHFINYNNVMENPDEELKQIKHLIPNYKKALKVIDPKLYRTKKKQENQMVTKEELIAYQKHLENTIKNVKKLIKKFPR